MKKRSTGNGTEGMGAWTVGMDLGDRTSHICVLDEGGTVVERGKVQTTREGVQEAVRRSGTNADRAGGGDALAVGEPPTERARARGAGSQPQEDPSDLPEPREAGSCGCRGAGEDRAAGPEAPVPRGAPARERRTGLGRAALARRAGEDADAARQPRARGGQGDGTAAEEVLDADVLGEGDGRDSRGGA